MRDKEATLSQAAQILNLVKQSKISRGGVQDFLENPHLALLLKADLPNVNVEEFKKVLHLE